MKDTCLRHAVALLAPDNLVCHNIVLHAARQGDSCRMYAEMKPSIIARGMNRIFDHVKPWEVKAIRDSLIPIFGSRSHFYRYNLGRYDITPQQQERVAAVFRSFGYEQPIHYDQTTECYYFNNA